MPAPLVLPIDVLWSPEWASLMKSPHAAHAWMLLAAESDDRVVVEPDSHDMSAALGVPEHAALLGFGDLSALDGRPQGRAHEGASWGWVRLGPVGSGVAEEPADTEHYAAHDHPEKPVSSPAPTAERREGEGELREAPG